MPYILTIDQGTTSTRAIVFTETGVPLSQSQRELKQYFPDDGWVEHDSEEIWQAVLTTCQDALSKSHLTGRDIATIGITNQRETTFLWDKQTGECLHKAIVWQDRRTADYCHSLIQQGLQQTVQQKTGLLLDPYFSATKLKWLLDTIPGARERAKRGELAFGTVDSFLLWRLTNGRAHLTDATNASRTLLYNIHTGQWDEELLTIFDIPRAVLPEVRDSSDDFGETESTFFGHNIPICGVAGDQQAATVGQACFQPGMVKSTYGTGCFMLMNTGEKIIQSENRLLTTIAYQLKGKATYGLEGSIFVAGAAVQWLRDAMQIIDKAADTEVLIENTHNNAGVYLVPAFTGLGAPYWDPLARGAIFGLTRDTGAIHIVRAALEAVCYQTKDLLIAMRNDSHTDICEIRVDGGMVVNNWLVQFLSNILAIPVTRPQVIETTALGVAYLAGLHVGIFKSLDDITKLWQAEQQFLPGMHKDEIKHLYDGWLAAIDKLRG